MLVAKIEYMRFDRIIAVSIIILLPSTVFAQIKMGIKAGININGLIVRDNPNLGPFNYDETKAGYHFGVNASKSISEKFNIHGELVFEKRRYADKWDQSGVLLPVSFNYVQDYISIPILIELATLNKIGLYIGPSFGYRLSDKLDTNDQAITQLYEKTFDSNEEIQLYTGIKISAIENFVLDLRYGYSLTNTGVIKYFRTAGREQSTIKDNGFRISFIYLLNSTQ